MTTACSGRLMIAAVMNDVFTGRNLEDHSVCLGANGTRGAINFCIGDEPSVRRRTECNRRHNDRQGCDCKLLFHLLNAQRKSSSLKKKAGDTSPPPCLAAYPASSYRSE